MSIATCIGCGFVIHYEDIHELADTPKNFTLATQPSISEILLEGGKIT